MFGHQPRTSRSDDRREVFGRSTADLLDRSEVRQECFAAFRPDAFYRIQTRHQGTLGTPEPVVRDTETVRLVAQLLDDAQGDRPPVQIEWERIARVEDLLQAFGQSDHLDAVGNAQFGDDLVRRAELPFSAVHDDQVREFLPFLQQTGGTGGG